MSKIKLIVLAGLFGFTLSGPLQHSGFLPQTSVGDASKAILKAVKNMVIPPAFAACGSEGISLSGTGTPPTVTVFYSGGGTTTGNGFPSAPTTAGPTASAGATGVSPGNGSAGAVPTTVATSAAAGGGSGSALPGGGGQGNGGFVYGDQSQTVGKAASSGQSGDASGEAGMVVTASAPILLPLAPPDERDQFKARVLLVEDQEEDREKLRLLLHMEGYLVVTATDGEQGLKSFASFRPDITFVDRELPGIDGLEFARKVRKGPSGKEAVLAVTGSGDERERREASAAGFDYYLAKPVDLAALQQALGGWASRTLRAAALTKARH